MLKAWNEFKRGKRTKEDVVNFELNLEENIFRLHSELSLKIYLHDPYVDFYICDPKRRHIHKASVRDRVFHQAVFRVLYLIFDKHFIYDSYSSRIGKGTHRGVLRLMKACRKISRNWKIETYVLKCDIRKFFDSIDHAILRQLIIQKVSDKEALLLIDVIFESFQKEKGKGLPLGNVTSQLFANIYLNELDQFVKHQLKAKHYFRYCDDFVIVHTDRRYLEWMIGVIRDFLCEKLLLELHPNKVEIRKVNQGIDFLGYIVLPRTTVIRSSTKKRIIRKLYSARNQFSSGELSNEKLKAISASYRGVLTHCRSRRLRSWCEKTM